MEKILRSYNPEEFRRIGTEVVDIITRHLERSSQGDQLVATIKAPNQELQKWRDYKIEGVTSFLKEVVDNTIHIHNPKFVGHQVSGPLPALAVAGLVSDILNAGMGVYEMGSAPTAIEKVVIEDFCKYLGYDANSDGFLTSGGTLGNLTALLAARSHCFKSSKTNQQYILVSEQAHYCADRAGTTMGLPTSHIIKIPTDSNYRMDMDLLEQKIIQLKEDDQPIMAVVASSCSTSTGSYDDLARISALCMSYKIWLHVDGAHGGPAIFSNKYRHLVEGIEMADSVVIDAHKMMMAPALVTAVLFKRGVDSYGSFVQEADYLFAEKEHEWYNLAKRTYETTKYMMSIKCYLLFRYYGVEMIGDYIDRQYDLARSFAQALVNRPNWKIAHLPMSNILCFRYETKGMSELEISNLNKHLRQEMTASGEFYIVQTMLYGCFYLRVTLMNHLTTIEHLSELCEKLEEISHEYLS